MERQKVEAEKIRKELNEEIAKISTEFEKKSQEQKKEADRVMKKAIEEALKKQQAEMEKRLQF